MTAFIRPLCLAALLAAGSAWAQQQPADNPDNPHSTQAKDKQKNATPQMILQKLHMANLEEIEMGKLAEQNGTDRVKSYAKTLETDHTDADRQVKALAQKKNLPLSDSPKNPEMQKKMDEAKSRFSNMKGAEFDRAFANHMSMGHKRLISMAQAWRQDCKDQDVCSLIDALMPKLQQHAQTADQLKGPVPMGRAPPENPVSR